MKEYNRALSIAYQLWKWLRENPFKEKKDWPLYNDYEKDMIVANCSICTFRQKYYPSNYKRYCQNYMNIKQCPFNDLCNNESRYVNDYVNGSIEKRIIFIDDMIGAIKSEMFR